VHNMCTTRAPPQRSISTPQRLSGQTND